jgi:hypothetical protein
LCLKETPFCLQAGMLYLETKIQAISLIAVVGETHYGRQETLEKRDSERGKREVVFVLEIFGMVAKRINIHRAKAIRSSLQDV